MATELTPVNVGITPQTATLISLTDSVTDTNLTVDVMGVEQLSIQSVYANATPAAEAFVAADVDPSATATGTMTIVAYNDASMSGAVVSVGGTDLTEGVDWTAGTSNDATATSLASAIDGIASVGAAAVGPLITITAAAAGTAGNSIATTTDADAAGMTVSGAMLAGGTDVSTITLDATAFFTGLKVALAGTNLPTGLSATNYWVIKVDVDTIRLATNLANAVAGTFVVISAAGTTADAELTPTSLGNSTFACYASNDASNWVALTSMTVTISAAGTSLFRLGSPDYRYLQCRFTAPVAGALDLTVTANVRKSWVQNQ